MLCLSIVLITILLIISSIIFFPVIKIKGLRMGSYWVIALLSALVLLCLKQVSWDTMLQSFLSNSSVNPIKILVLFISMTILSIFLDEIGFFHFIASKATKLFKNNQLKLFFGFYALISILTLFTSNDIIILTFTPFICYYAKNTKINPIPYLVLEFIAANTWSMTLIIGNPTNIYLASSMNIDFLSYLKHMILPTIFASITSLSLLYLIFKKQLSKPMEEYKADPIIPNRFLTAIGLIHLLLATGLLAVASYIGLEMWIITISFATSLIIIVLLYLCIKRKKVTILQATLLRAPWSLIPFVLSMFVIVLSLNEQGITSQIQSFLQGLPQIYSYGICGTITANLINNIPMSVFFSNLLTGASSSAIYASIIASNISAFMTPLGALAGIMWMRLLKTYDINFRFKDFIFYGCSIGIPTLLISLAALYIL